VSSNRVLVGVPGHGRGRRRRSACWGLALEKRQSELEADSIEVRSVRHRNFTSRDLHLCVDAEGFIRQQSTGPVVRR
jgi:hypothetical protein